MAVQGLVAVARYNGGAACHPFEGDYLVCFVEYRELGRHFLFDELFYVLKGRAGELPLFVELWQVRANGGLLSL